MGLTMAQPSNGHTHDPRDAYVDWIIKTQQLRFFDNYRKPGDPQAVGLLIRLRDTVLIAERARILASHGVGQVPLAYTGSVGAAPTRRTWALSVPALQLSSFVDAIAPFVDRIELAAPIAQPLTNPRSIQFTGQAIAETLAVVMDDGCAFANARFMDAGKTRVMWLWNQDPLALGLALDSISGPTPRADFGYGAQWPQSELDRIIGLQPGQQDAIYELAGLQGLRRHAAHGPHMMDLLLGDQDWPMVFVQFPQEAVDDPSGLWLKRFAFDGLHYAIECAGPQTKIVVNLSWGPQTGPHDGLSLFELAIDELVAEQRAKNRELIVTLPAGNSFESRAHAMFGYREGRTLQWVVPPDGRTPAFLEVWWPPSVAPADAALSIVPPGAAAEVILPGERSGTDWYVNLKRYGNSTMALLVINPTQNEDPEKSGRAGRWTLTFAGRPQATTEQVHLYVARADHNMGAKRRAKASHLIDDGWEAARFLAPHRRHEEAPGSAISKGGTLNGIATGAETHVAAGFRHSDLGVAPYSSSGPTRGARPGPDFACVTDMSPALPGIRATAVRSGTNVRLVGTSTAAPQLGQILAAKTVTKVPDPPTIPSPPVRIGGGRLKPDPKLFPPR